MEETHMTVTPANSDAGVAALAQMQQKASPIAVPPEPKPSPIEVPKLAESGSVGTKVNAWA